MKTDTPDCIAPTTRADMSRCADEDFLTANGAQAAVQNDLKQRLPTLDLQRLCTMPKTWIAWRTSQCAAESGGSSGATSGELARWICTTKLTRERTVALDRLAACPKGDIVRSGRKP